MKFLLALLLMLVGQSVLASYPLHPGGDPLFTRPEMLWPLIIVVLLYLIAMGVFGEQHNAQYNRYRKALRFLDKGRIGQAAFDKINLDAWTKARAIKRKGYQAMVLVGMLHFISAILSQPFWISALTGVVSTATALLLLAGIFALRGAPVVHNAKSLPHTGGFV